MHDTSADVAELVRQFHAGLTPEQRQRALIRRLHGEAAVPPPSAWPASLRRDPI